MGASRILKITNGGEVEFYEPSAGGSSYISVLAPALAASWSLTLPPDDGAADSILRSDGAGVTTWVTSLTSFGVTNLTVTDLIVNDEVRVTEPGGPSYVSIVAPALAATWTLTLPPDDGAADTLLRTDGAGTTTWVAGVTAFDVDALTSDGITLLDNGTLSLREAVAGGASAVILQAPAALVGDLTLTLPGADGGADDVLVTDGAGNLSFKETLASLTITTLTSAGVTITSEGLLTLREHVTHGVNEVTLKAPHDLAADTDYTFPTAIVAGNFLQTDAGGQLSWAASAATLQTAYDAGEDIVMIADTMDWSQNNDNGMLSLTKTGGGAGTVLTIHNDGTGGGLSIHQDGNGYPLFITNDGTQDTLTLTQTANSSGLVINKTGVGAGNPISIHNDGTAHAISIEQDGNAYALNIQQDGVSEAIVVTENGAADAVYIHSLAGHACLTLIKDNVNVDPLLYITNNSPNYDAYSSVSGWYITALGGFSIPGIVHPHSHLTIDGADSITVTSGLCYIYVDTAGGAASDTLNTINGGTDGQVLILQPESGARTVRVDNGGNIATTGIFDMDNLHDVCMLIYNSGAGKWCPISLQNNGA